MEKLDNSDNGAQVNIVTKYGERSDLPSNNSSIRSSSLAKNEKLEEDFEELSIQQLAKILVNIFIEIHNGNKKGGNIL